MAVAVIFGLLFTSFFALPAYAGAPKVSARAFVLMEAKTGALLYAKNENERRSMASTTKIMTALTVLEDFDLDKKCTISSHAANTEGSALGLHEGDVLSVYSLLYALMLVSGNDAAVALAESCAGSEEAFVAQMNRKAAQLGLKNTHFANASGLTDDKHFSSASDMAHLTRYALQNKQFERLCTCKDKNIRFLKPKKTVTLHNHNRLLSEYEGCIGVKTGYTERAGRCLVSAARRAGVTLIVVSLSDARDWSDHKALFDFGFHRCVEVRLEGEKTIPVVGAQVSTLRFDTEPFRLLLPEKVAKEVKTVVCAPHFLYAPVKKGEKIGEVRFVYRGKTIATHALYAGASANIKHEKETSKKLWQIWK